MVAVVRCLKSAGTTELMRPNKKKSSDIKSGDYCLVCRALWGGAPPS